MMLLLPAELEQVADAAGDRDAPVRVAEEAFERDVVAAVELGADVLRVAAEAGEIGAEADHEAGMRIDPAVAVVERQRLAELRQQRVPGLVVHVERAPLCTL